MHVTDAAAAGKVEVSYPDVVPSLTGERRGPLSESVAATDSDDDDDDDDDSNDDDSNDDEGEEDSDDNDDDDDDLSVVIDETDVLHACQELIESLRREEFGVNVKLSEDGQRLMDKQQERLGRSLERLSKDLYSKDTHFVLELVQNADDNPYPDEMFEYVLNYLSCVCCITYHVILYSNLCLHK